VPVLARSPGPLELAACGLRAPDPAEVAMLVATGAQAMVSIPLRRNGELWGAVACCHGEARRLPFAVRPALEVLGCTLGLLIELARGSGGTGQAVAADGEGGTARLSGRVLVVEDNMLIAMEAEEIVQELGAGECDVAGSVAMALRLLDAHAYDFALLDIELGHETSEAVAHALAARQVRFVYASGYGGPDALSPGFPRAPVVTKPYGTQELAETIRRMG
jgi:CheY-like chemotaxis protein